MPAVESDDPGAWRTAIVPLDGAAAPIMLAEGDLLLLGQPVQVLLVRD